MPPWACSKQPAERSMAPVNAPFSWPNNSLSIRVSGKAAALIATKGPLPRGLHLWISRATNSFPVPLSPQINTGAEVGATCLMSEKICCIAGEVPTRSPSTPRRLRSRLSSSVFCRLLL